MVQRIDEADNVEVGKFYLVPCVQCPVDLEGYDAGEWIPILTGGLHQDPEIGADFYHYHYDLRFWPVTGFRPSWSLSVSFFNETMGYWPNPNNPPLITWRQRKCTNIRSMPTHDKYPLLYEIYRNTPLNCSICPHRGTSLRGIQPNANGHLVCPAHGLRWADGVLVPPKELGL